MFVWRLKSQNLDVIKNVVTSSVLNENGPSPSPVLRGVCVKKRPLWGGVGVFFKIDLSLSWLNDCLILKSQNLGVIKDVATFSVLIHNGAKQSPVLKRVWASINGHFGVASAFFLRSTSSCRDLMFVWYLESQILDVIKNVVSLSVLNHNGALE